MSESTGGAPPAGLLVLVVIGAALSVGLVGAASGAQSGPQVSIDPIREQIAPGETVQVGVSVENPGDTVRPAPVVDLGTLPDGWTFKSWSGTDASYRNTSHEWLWTTLEPGAVQRYTITLAAPEGATGEETIVATLTDGTGYETTATTTITVSDEGAAQGGAGVSIGSGPGFGVGTVVVAVSLLVAVRASRAE